ncbi:MAG TPA: hypothetical protein VHB21_28065 [Minicystis sp.]|nr:hypothetical protein [Minicystis sp.]
MTRPNRALLLAVAALAVAGCRGKLLATAHLTSPGKTEVHFYAGKSVTLWADTEGTWLGSKHAHFPAHYEIDVVQNGKPAGHVTCDADKQGGTVICGTQTTFGNEHTGDCEIELECSLPKLVQGDALLRVTGSVSDPSRVRRIKNMSLNVRSH